MLREFGRYMHRHRIQANGELRDSDNWQKGIPLDAYMKSSWRHFMDWWSLHRGLPTTDFDGNPVDIKDALTAVLFNAMGYLHELLRQEQVAERPKVGGRPMTFEEERSLRRRQALAEHIIALEERMPPDSLGRMSDYQIEQLRKAACLGTPGMEGNAQ